MGYIDDDGNLIVSGRKDDMIKINGNRIEPAEIEATIKSLLNINTAIAKGFFDNDRAFIVLYYLNSEAKEIFDKLDMDDFRVKLSKYLPYYMIPTYYEGLDEIPLNANSKLNKKALPKPNVDDKRSKYEPPVTNTEKIICETMEKILNISKVGLNDDFFILSGDSLHAIDFINKCSNLKLNSGDIYKYRTPSKIAKYLESIDNKFKDIHEFEKQNELSKMKEQELLPEQISIIDHQFFGIKTDMWNIPILLKLKADTDFNRFKKSVIKVLSHHPVFKTKFKINENGDFVQYYDDTISIDIPVIDVSDLEFKKIRENFIKHFDLINSLLYRAFFYKTESSIYFFMDIHHLICDGTSILLLTKQIYECYMDENIILPTDYYYSYVEKFVEEQKNELVNDEKIKFDELYSKYPNLDALKGELKKDSRSIEYECDVYEYPLNISIKSKYDNVFFLTAVAMAISKFNNEENALFRWTYNYRDSIEKNNMLGLLYINFPIVVQINKNIVKEKLMEEIKKQVEFSITNSKYPYVYKHPMQFIDSPIVLYQKNIGLFEKIFEIIEWGKILFPEIKYSNTECTISVHEKQDTSTFIIRIHYSKSNYKKTSIDRLFGFIKEAVEYLDNA